MGLLVRISPETWMLVLCKISKDKKAKCRIIKDKETSTDEVQSTRKHKKKIPVEARFSSSVQAGSGGPLSFLYNGYRVIVGG
jgi:hypothetical protein